MFPLKIFSLEGLDKAGKATQSRLLAEALQKQGVSVVQSEFHRYDTPTGGLIAEWLRREYPVDQITIELIMAADKQAQQEWIQSLEEQGVDVLILDRYTLSQFVYAQANGVDKNFTITLQRFMRQPDHNIIIDIPAEVSMSRKGKHNNGENDRYESDLAMLRKVRELYLTSVEPTDFVVDGTKEIEEIHQAIYNFVVHQLNIS